MFVMCCVLLALMGFGIAIRPLVVHCQMGGEQARSQVMVGSRQVIAQIIGLLLMFTGFLLLLLVLTGRIVLPLH